MDDGEDLSLLISIPPAPPPARGTPPRRFLIAKYPVTNRQFQRFIDDGGYDSDTYWGRQPPRPRPKPPDVAADPAAADHPVSGISWLDAHAYTNWLNSRWDSLEEGRRNGPIPAGWVVVLPTAPEWVWAAGGPDREYPWGRSWDPSRANTAESGIGRTTPVTAHDTGASPHDVRDMAGNVYEYTDPVPEPPRPRRFGDVYDELTGRGTDDHVYLMGGSYLAQSWLAQVTGTGVPARLDARREDAGFRICVRGADTVGYTLAGTRQDPDPEPAGQSLIVKPAPFAAAGNQADEPGHSSLIGSLREAAALTDTPLVRDTIAHIAYQFACSMISSLLATLPPGAFGVWAALGDITGARRGAELIAEAEKTAQAQAAIASVLRRGLARDYDGMPAVAAAWAAGVRSVSGGIDLARWLTRSGDPQGARDVLGSLIARLPHAQAARRSGWAVALAEEALRGGAPNLCADALRCAAGTAGDEGGLPEHVLFKRAELAIRCGQFRLAEAFAAEIPPPHGEDWLKLAAYCEQLTQVSSTPASDVASAAHSAELRAEAWLAAGTALAREGRPAEALPNLTSAREAAMNCQNDDDRIDYLIRVASAMASADLRAEARATLQTAESQALRLQEDRAYQGGQALLRLSDALHALGETSWSLTAVRAIESALTRADGIGALALAHAGGATRDLLALQLKDMFWHSSRRARNPATRDLGCRDFAMALAARRQFDHAVGLADQIQGKEVTADTRRYIAHALASAGRRDQAEEQWRLATAVAAQLEPQRPGTIRVRGALLATAKQVGNEAAAESELSAIVGGLQRITSITDWLEAAPGLAVTLADSGYLEHAWAIVNETENTAQQMNEDGALWAALALRATAAAFRAHIGLRDQARELLSALLGSERTLNDPWQQAKVLTEISAAEAALGDWTPAAEHLEEALNLLRAANPFTTAAIYEQICRICVSGGLTQTLHLEAEEVTRLVGGGWLCTPALQGLLRVTMESAQPDTGGHNMPLSALSGNPSRYLSFGQHIALRETLRLAASNGPSHVFAVAGTLCLLLPGEIDTECALDLHARLTTWEKLFDNRETFIAMTKPFSRGDANG